MVLIQIRKCIEGKNDASICWNCVYAYPVSVSHSEGAATEMRCFAFAKEGCFTFTELIHDPEPVPRWSFDITGDILEHVYHNGCKGFVRRLGTKPHETVRIPFGTNKITKCPKELKEFLTQCGRNV